MRTLAAVDLLTAWEKGRAAPQNAGSVLALLAAAYPAESWRALAELSIGERDTLLLALREHLFGSHLYGLVSCPACNEMLELELSLADLHVAGEAPRVLEPLAFTAEEYSLEFRLPNSLDLIAVADVDTVESGRLRLLERVLLSASRNGESIAVSELPESILLLAESHMAAADPQADVELNVACTICHRRCDTLFDIASFVWKEVDTWAIRLLREIHELACAYGWREADIIAMSPWRRRCYMEMLGV